MKTIHTDKAPKALGPYSQAICSNGFLFTSGQGGIDPESGKLVDGGVQAQTEQAIKNLMVVCEAAGTDINKAVKTTCFLADMADFAAFNEIYAKYFTSKPARSCVAVKELPAGFACEIEAVVEL